ncbi:serine/threonine-protein kinase [Nocardiopsis suaedae]|uniref:Serine/threonine-protein kinase n=1 Tax=Nocardiopsis suaedae TaxID=3018444 RepID=A0ABT4TI03_9ACTN|nr:serine/threonine-protein kinase [Nocardiopsis suaedae]MDA2804343.1 serine/threonine-protein kinase [Nocardiopsis suaedae]
MAMTAGFPEGEELPERVGPYTIRRRIGQGGMGVVYQGHDPRQDRFVAIKVLRSEVAGDAIARARLAREVETMRRVRSRNVAEVIDADTDAELPWVVTEYIPGPTLDATVENHGPLRGRALTRFVGGMARAIDDIHAAEVIHRDLKPGNVIISNGEPIVIDFGIAHAVDGAKLTQTGTFVGTPSYLSPEVIEGTALGPATDVHAWGATVAFASTGTAPYGAGSFEVIFFRILNGEISLDGMPDQLRPLVTAAVSRDMEARPTAAQLVAETGRLNLDLPLSDDMAAYAASGTTGSHTVHAPMQERPPQQQEQALYAEPEAPEEPEAPRTQAFDPSSAQQAPQQAQHTQVAPSEPEPQVRTYYADDDEDDGAAQGPHTQYFNSTLRPEDFRDILTPVGQEQGRGGAPDQTAMFGGDGVEEGYTTSREYGGEGGGRRSRTDRWSDYFGGYGGDEYDDERWHLPKLYLLPVAALIAGLALVVPTIGLVLGMLAVSVLGALDKVKSDHARRLQTRGPRSSDTMVVALSMPVALIRSLGVNLLFGMGYLLVGVVLGIIIGLVTDTNTANNVGSYAVFFMVLGSMVGPNGKGARRQAMELVDKAGFRNVYVYWGVIVFTVLFALLVLSFGFTSAPVWTGWSPSQPFGG